MRYILVLFLSGSVMELIYFALKKWLIGRVPIKWHYCMLRVVLFFYLMPLPFLKYIYESVIDYCLNGKQFFGGFRFYTDRSLLVYSSGRLLVNQTLKNQWTVMGIWFLIAVGLILWQCIRYLSAHARLSQYGKKFTPEADLVQVEQLRKRYGIRRKVDCVGTSGNKFSDDRVFTTGIVNPVIVCLAEIQGREKEMVLEHEIIHIKRWDILWKLLLSAVRIIHWYNPLVWILVSEFEKICEMSCDEQVMKGKGKDEKAKYCEVLIAMALGEQENKAYQMGLSKGGKQLKERIDNMMKDKKKCLGKVVSACIFGVAVFLNSLTVFAYEDVQFARAEKDNEEFLEMVLYHDCAFLPYGDADRQKYSLSGDLDKEANVIYDLQFTDLEGNVYPVSENGTEVYASCAHNFVEGEVQKHIKYANGSCTVIYYSAKRCTECGSVQIEKEQRRMIYQSCPH